jgi:hypothetical protein
MSTTGQGQTFRNVCIVCVFIPKADIRAGAINNRVSLCGEAKERNHPSATPLVPMIVLSFLVMLSMRSAAPDNAAAIDACVALLRSDSTVRASSKAASSSSSRLTRSPASANSSATVIAAIAVKRASPISPNLARSAPPRLSRSPQVQLLGRESGSGGEVRLSI